MTAPKNNRQQEPTLLETILRLQGDFRRELEPIGVTPLQGGVMTFLYRHADSQVRDVAAALSVQGPTMEAIRNLERKGWVIKRRLPEDGRGVCLRLSRKGYTLADKILNQLQSFKLKEV